MRALTEEQVKNLHDAIRLAREPGRCRYVLGDEPCCIIAQLATIEGMRVGPLGDWDHANAYNRPERVRVLNPTELAGYPMRLLQFIQDKWDNSVSGEEADTRQAMHDLVDGEALWLA